MLLGHLPAWKLPVSLLLGSTVTLAGLGALLLEGARASAMAHISIPVLMMQSCGPLMAITATLTLALIMRRRPTRKSSRTPTAS